MSDQSQVLREYLLALGFRVNTQESKKFDGVLAGVTKGAAGAGAAVVALGAAAAAMATAYANSMEKLFYSSKRSGSTVKQIQALEYAGEQVGISADAMRGGIEGMAKALRGNPALQGLLKQFGVKTEGRTSAQEMLDLVEALRKMPFFQAKQFAAMFGIDEDTFQTLAQNLDKIRELAAAREAMDDAANVNIEENAKAMHEWKNSIREVMGAFTVLEGVVAQALLPLMRDLTSMTKGWLQDITTALNTTRDKDWWGKGGKLEAVASSLTGNGKPSAAPAVPARDPTDNGLLNKGAMNTLQSWRYAIVKKFTKPGYAEAHGIFPPSAGGAPSGATATGTGSSQSTEEMFAALEQQYGLPRGVLDSLWDQESTRGTNMVSPTGVIGHFQLTGKMRKAYGVTDPYNLSQEAVAAAELLADNLKMHGGNLPKALAQWNGGTAAGRDLALGSDETKAFVPSVLHKIEQHNNITVHANDPRGVTGAVKEALDTSNGNLVREMRSVTQ